MEHSPKFLRPGQKEELIFNIETWRLLRVGLFTPIEHVAVCRAKKIPVRRGILLAGPYGTGKTLTALATASAAVQHGWTFWYAPDGRDFCSAIELARQYEPAVVFVEDIDRITAGERDRALDQVLNVLDGLDSKQSEILVVVTTNDLDAIHPAMLRPGRIDSVIELGMPDAVAAGRLATLYGGEFISEDLAETVSGQLAGKSPAVIREIVERAKLAAVLRVAEGGDMTVSADDLAAIASMVESHAALAGRPVKRSGRRYPEAMFRIPGDQVDLIDSIAYMIKESQDSGKEK
jgi:transitional endoplasmic reticulum ATPase